MTLGALLPGVPSPDGSRYIGNVGTGFTDAVLADLFTRLTQLAQSARLSDPTPAPWNGHRPDRVRGGEQPPGE